MESYIVVNIDIIESLNVRLKIVMIARTLVYDSEKLQVTTM